MEQETTFDVKNLKPMDLTENQLKVIKDKYLKDSPTPEAWLMTICNNIALSQVLHMDEVKEEDVFKNVNYKIIKAEVSGKLSPVFLLHHKLDKHNERDKNFKQFLRNLQDIVDSNQTVKVRFLEVREKFYKMLSSFEFLPNSPTLMNAGRALQQLSACYVLPVEDSIEGIYTSVKNMAIIHKSGGGTGFAFSRLRPANDEVKSTKGISSGPISFMQIFDKSTDVVKQGGTRRGANMGIMRYDHPNIMDFIDMKKTPGVMENFNVSVAITEDFMKKVKSGEDYDLINPHTKKVDGKLNAAEVFDKLVQGAWETGDPGIVIIDRINNSDSNPTPHIGQIESTNPCGEQPLLPYEPCNLGSINLSKFVDETALDMDWEKLKECVHTSTHFLDNVIDINNYPIPEIEHIAKMNRRIGLGVMGWAETLVRLKIPYNDPAAFEKGEQVMKFINDECMAKSEELAKVRGIFPNWHNSIFDSDGKFFRNNEAKPRNCARTTIAPTGTIGITAGLQGAGIEPFFAVVYTRYNAAAIDALKNNETPDDKDVFYEINPYFEKIAEQYDYFGMKPEELWKKVDDNHKSLVGIDEVPEQIQKLFLTAHDLSPLDHVRMQAAFQRHTNNAVSKTVNFANEATPDDIREVYELAFETGCKGVTVYRDGCKALQILNINEKKTEESESEEEKQIVPKSRERKSMLSSHYYEMQTGEGSLHVHINFDEEGPLQIFANLSPTGTEISGLASGLGIVISKYLQEGGDPVVLLKHLNSIKGDKPVGFGPNKISSVPHAISKALRDHLVRTGKLENINGQQTLDTTPDIQQQQQQPTQSIDEDAESQLYCPKCFSVNVGVVGGCSGPTCFDCGYSKCS